MIAEEGVDDNAPQSHRLESNLASPSCIPSAIDPVQSPFLDAPRSSAALHDVDHFQPVAGFAPGGAVLGPAYDAAVALDRHGAGIATQSGHQVEDRRARRDLVRL